MCSYSLALAEKVKLEASSGLSKAMQNVFRLRGTVLLLVVGAISVGIRFLPESAKSEISDALATDNMPDSEYWRIVEGSIHDGDTLRVQRNGEELKIRLCGVDSPEKQQPLGIEARDHLRSLINQGDGTVIVLPIERARYGRTVAELFIPTSADEEIHLNSQMTADGMAYVYPQYVDGCPNATAIAAGENMAKDGKRGVWSGNYQLPWDYRQIS